jgi:hypothetical protein
MLGRGIIAATDTVPVAPNLARIRAKQAAAGRPPAAA